MTTRRDDLLAGLAARLRRPGPGARRALAVGLGWLVLMTVWGFGRAWRGDPATGWLVAGLLLATAATAVAWRAADRRGSHDPDTASGHDPSA